MTPLIVEDRNSTKISLTKQNKSRTTEKERKGKEEKFIISQYYRIEWLIRL